MRMWARAVEEASTFSSDAVREKLYTLEYDGPSGRVQMASSNYLGKPTRIATLGKKGYRITEDSNNAITPQPNWLFPGMQECSFHEIVCSPGHQYDRASDSCTACTRGTFQDGPACTPCRAGTVAALDGMRSCDPCPPGSFQDLTGQLVCNFCGLDTYSDVSGQKECKSCPSGTSNNRAGATSKNLCSCPVDTYFVCDDP